MSEKPSSRTPSVLMNSADQIRAAELACRCVLRLGKASLPVDPYAMLRYSRGVYIFPLEEIPSNISAIAQDALLPLQTGKVAAVSFMTDPGHCVICYQPDVYPPRLRFSMAHELGHIALRHTQTFAGHTRAEEKQADLFASCLLIPPPLLRLLWQKHRDLYAEQIAGIFGVSPLAASCASDNVLIPLHEETQLRIVDLLLDETRRRFPPRISSRWHPMPKPSLY